MLLVVFGKAGRGSPALLSFLGLGSDLQRFAKIKIG
jgi:hypothetical protein